MSVKFLDHVELDGTSRVRFVGDPVDAQDAANRRWVIDRVSTALAEAGALDVEGVQDVVGAMLTGTGITAAYNDAAGTITLTVTDSPTVGGRTPAYLMARANHTGTQSLDTTTDSATRVAMTAAERTKLTGVEDGATANADDAVLLARANHTGTQPLATITGHDKAAHDALDIDAATVDGATPADLRARASHTGTQSLDTTTDSATRLALTPAERTKLSGVATGATANSTDAALRDRATHTGTQDLATITGHNKAAHDALLINAASVNGMTAADIQAAVTAAIVDGAPGTLDTLNEIAAALGDNPAAITDLTAAIALRNRTVAATIGDGATTSFVVTHGLGSRDVIVQIYETGGDFDTVNTTVRRSTTDAVTVVFANPPAAGAYRVVVQGRPDPA